MMIGWHCLLIRRWHRLGWMVGCRVGSRGLMMGRWILFGICLCEVMGKMGVVGIRRSTQAQRLSPGIFSLLPKEIVLARCGEKARNTLPASVLSRNIWSSSNQTSRSSKLDITPAEIPYHSHTLKTQHPTSPSPSLYVLIPNPRFCPPSAILLWSHSTPHPQALQDHRASCLHVYLPHARRKPR